MNAGPLGRCEILSDLGVRRLTILSVEGVGKPAFGEVYTGIGREGGRLFTIMVPNDKMKKTLDFRAPKQYIFL